MARALRIRLGRRHLADVVEEFMPEAAVKQMQRRMLHAAVVPVDGEPVVERFLARERLVVVRVRIAQEIPRGTGPLGHRVRLALGRAAAVRARRIDPVGHLRERRLAVVGRLIALDLRQAQRQLLFRQRHVAALFALDNRDRLAPIALAREDPVAQLIVDLLVAEALFLHVVLDLFLRLFDGKAV